MKLNKATGYYESVFNAYFFVDIFEKAFLESKISNAITNFNGLERKLFKSIEVTIDINKKCLKVKLISSIDIERRNWLRSIQYFSKLLALEEGMEKYIYGRRLLFS